MSTSKSETALDALKGVMIMAAFILIVGGLLYGYYKLVENAQDNKDFKAVCAYEGGHVEGDVCVKNNTVILTQDQWKEKVK